ncbi:hypothetical protein SULI_03720 [Saccharolobus solfataricus]|uniref:Uncharacterized protein n=1 Tax=Saccharolobus solfataricus TaxID=2287 RepID=A0A3G8EG41_SACSO|nr:hypothetical protein SULB_03080 [Saccharolobus solfataricus]AYN75745.1 hypothetical protein SULC_03085 [Saccharolobus solfataricus]AYP18580.1 hypothetical protein SULA_03085 [Saccharolobus solfataricus]AZF67608.1 hypothetical protein SULG_03720 [Saccharolobus solfataricus]AZF70228.1 hypothetical protein SULH_03720 [Saccharolobus solfataricus]
MLVSKAGFITCVSSVDYARFFMERLLYRKLPSSIEGLMRLREEQKVSFSLSRDPDNVDDGSPQLWLSVYPDYPPNEIVNRCWEQ